MDTMMEPVEMAAKTQEFAHRVVEFADTKGCIKYFQEKAVDFDCCNGAGWTLLMTVCAHARSDLVGYVLDRTTNLAAATTPNGTTVLHLAAMSPEPAVIKEMVATEQRVAKLLTVVNTPNRNGDTPLMMACVAKNQVTAETLVRKLRADVSLANIAGLTPLMCAARLSDEREGTPLRSESEAIVRVLLDAGAAINAVDHSGQQTALHFALLTNNQAVVGRLLETRDLDVTLRNKAGHSPLALARQLKLESSLVERLEKQWNALELAAQRRGEELAEPEPSSVNSDERKSKAKKKKNKNNKHKSVVNSSEETPASPPTSRFEEIVDSEEESTAQVNVDRHTETKSVEEVEVEMKAKEDLADSEPSVDVAEPDASEGWHEAVTRRQKKMPSASVRPSQRQRQPSKRTGTQPVSAPAKPTSATPSSAPVALSSSPPSANTPNLLPSPRSQSLTYEDLAEAFHRMFPVAADVDIPVEGFVAGAPTEGADLLAGLSISQLEVLQEAHLRAYHYLNERRMEMIRELEAERVAVQLEVYRQVLELE
ncbi:hypothetical protein ATCC90586_001391 [Pythium insidiosum]|nr:hypothetical protein ATCC90586_001391 [Pythium insidiosum]